MDAVHTLNFSNGLLGIEIDNFNLGAVGDIETARGLIDGEVVLAPVTRQRNGLQQVVTGIGCREPKRNDQDNQCLVASISNRRTALGETASMVPPMRPSGRQLAPE